jgi:hypothetical protein
MGVVDFVNYSSSEEAECLAVLERSVERTSSVGEG